MTTVTRFDIDTIIFFLFDGAIQSAGIKEINNSIYKKENEERETVLTYYRCLLETKIWVTVSEMHAFESKDELIKTITERFYQSQEAGNA